MKNDTAFDQAEAGLAAMQHALKVCAETWNTVDEWLGSASTRQAAMDALWRMRRALEAAGYPTNESIRDNISWRGSVLESMERAGIGRGSDNEIRFRLLVDPPWAQASGPRLAEYVNGLRRYARHEEHCDVMRRGEPGVCTCGLAGVISPNVSTQLPGAA